MSGDKELKKKVEELEDLYEKMIDSFDLSEIAWQYRTWINVFRNTPPERALSEEKIAALEDAVADFEAVYEAEKAEAAKMPLSWAEAERLRKLFSRIFRDRFAPPPETRKEH